MCNIEERLNILSDYADIVKKCYNENKNQFIQNSDITHAKYLSYYLIKKAKKNIKIFSGSMHEAVFDDPAICQALADAKKNNVDITVILEKDASQKMTEFCRKNNIEMRLILESKKIKDANHFLLVDNRAFRVEKTHDEDAFEKNEICADVNFNNKNWGITIDNAFLHLMNNSKVVIKA